jgi:hypothetical protein
MYQSEIKAIQKMGKEGQGRSELIRHLKGEKLTRGEAILAECYDCTGWYTDGAKDCESPNCPFYQFMPYRENKNQEETHV